MEPVLSFDEPAQLNNVKARMSVAREGLESNMLVTVANYPSAS